MILSYCRYGQIESIKSTLGIDFWDAIQRFLVMVSHFSERMFIASRSRSNIASQATVQVLASTCSLNLNRSVKADPNFYIFRETTNFATRNSTRFSGKPHFRRLKSHPLKRTNARKRTKTHENARKRTEKRMENARRSDADVSTRLTKQNGKKLLLESKSRAASNHRNLKTRRRMIHWVIPSWHG
jgi:hypothetical protein